MHTHTYTSEHRKWVTILRVFFSTFISVRTIIIFKHLKVSWNAKQFKSYLWASFLSGFILFTWHTNDPTTGQILFILYAIWRNSRMIYWEWQFFPLIFFCLYFLSFIFQEINSQMVLWGRWSFQKKKKKIDMIWTSTNNVATWQFQH